MDTFSGRDVDHLDIMFSQQSAILFVVSAGMDDKFKFLKALLGLQDVPITKRGSLCVPLGLLQAANVTLPFATLIPLLPSV
jgi:hypothetical protein